VVETEELESQGTFIMNGYKTLPIKLNDTAEAPAPAAG
jgi:hypothetical protein